MALTNPDDMLVTMELTMTVGEWKSFRQRIDTTYPGWAIASAISKLISKSYEAVEEVIEYEH